MVFDQAHSFEINNGAFYDIKGNQYDIHIANVNLAALNNATQQYPNMNQHTTILGAFLNRLKDLLLEVDRQRSQTPVTTTELKDVNSACESLKNIVTTIATKDLAWRLYHSEKIVTQLQETEDAISSAIHTFQLDIALDTHNYLAQIQDARQRDKELFSQHLDEAALNDQTILSALNTGSQGHGTDRYKSESLAEAFVRLSSDFPSASSDSERKFIQKAEKVLCRLSNYTKPVESHPWHLNALEVTFNTNDKAFLGRGGFGSVYRGEWNGLAVAVKVMNYGLARIADQWSLDLFQREVKIWASLSHPHILPFYGACLAASQPFIVSSLCNYGNARQFLIKFPGYDTVTILYHVALAMNYLHQKNIIHCDLKADNILIDESKNAVVTDFGVVSIRNHLTSSAAFHPDNIQEVNGTLRWMAPERLDGQPLKRSSDLYSFAITAWELYSGGAIPFADVPDGLLARVVVENERRPPRPASLGNNDLWSIIRASWLPDPDKRPTFSELYPKLKTLSHLPKEGGLQDEIHSIHNSTPSSVKTVSPKDLKYIPAVKKYEHSISPQKPLETASYQIINAKFDNAVAGLLDGNDGTPLTGNFKHDVTKGTWNISSVGDGRYTIKNVKFGTHAIANDDAPPFAVVWGMDCIHYWNITEAGLKGQYIVSAIDTGLIWGMADRPIPKSVILSKDRKEARNWWIFKKV